MKLFRLKDGNHTNQKFNGSALRLVVLVLACFGISPIAQAVVPAPDGAYPGGNTAEGQVALLSLTTGGFNTAVGFFSLRSDTTGELNTAIGAGTLFANTTASENTAIGAGALLSNMGTLNTANGAFALFSNTTGNANTANGDRALFSNTTGDSNTALGFHALFSTTTGISNTANGSYALNNNTAGLLNTANGGGALAGNTTGSSNIALGFGAGNSISTANNVICIGAAGANVGDSCYIGNIFGQTSASGAAVYVNSNHKLGTLTSSCRFKDDIKPMKRVSEALFALKPVTFHDKKEIDPAGMQQFGLVAEDVEKINPELVVRDKEGKPYSVRYEQVNAMLLNEFLKEHRKVEQLKAEFDSKLAKQQRQIEALTAGLEKVSPQIELTKTAANVVAK